MRLEFPCTIQGWQKTAKWKPFTLTVQYFLKKDIHIKREIEERSGAALKTIFLHVEIRKAFGGQGIMVMMHLTRDR